MGNNENASSLDINPRARGHEKSMSANFNKQGPRPDDMSNFKLDNPELALKRKELIDAGWQMAGDNIAFKKQGSALVYYPLGKAWGGMPKEEVKG